MPGLVRMMYYKDDSVFSEPYEHSSGIVKVELNLS